MDLSEIREIETAAQEAIEFVGTNKVSVKQWNSLRNLLYENYDYVYEETLEEYYGNALAFVAYVTTPTESARFEEEGSGIIQTANVRVIVTEKELRAKWLINANDVMLLTIKYLLSYGDVDFAIIHVERKARLVDQNLITIIWGYDASGRL